MQKFQGDGFVYLGRVSLAQSVPNQEEVKQQAVAPVVEDGSASSGYVELLRATPPGDFYSARWAGCWESLLVWCNDCMKAGAEVAMWSC